MYAAKIGKKTIRGKYITEKKYVNTTNSPQGKPKSQVKAHFHHQLAGTHVSHTVELG